MIEREILAEIVGGQNISNTKSTLDEYSRDISFVHSVIPDYVVKPANAEQVRKLVKLANKTATPLVPVSSQGPHFRGDTVPNIGGAIMVDLSSMKKIVRIDRVNRVAICEPGVTYGELIPALAKEGLRVIMPLSPRKTKSVVGALLEREPPMIPIYHWDIADPLNCVEVIFGTGDMFRTGSAAGPGTLEEQWASYQSQNEAAGPSAVSLHRVIQGAQGTIGIVTWASIRLELLPSLEKPFLIGSSRLEKIQELAYWLVRRKLVNECLILNNVNLAAIMAKKWPDDFYRIKNSLPPWVLFLNIAGYEYLPAEKVKYQTTEMLKIAQNLDLKVDSSLGELESTEVLKSIRTPSDSDDPYWKLRYKGSSQDIVFLSMYERVPEYIKILTDTATEYGYPVSDIGIYLQQIVQGCNWHCEFNLPYDPNKDREVNLVKDLTSALTERLLNNKAFFSRPYGENTSLIMNKDAATVNSLRKVKNIMDPNNIMNPGKLCF